MAKFGSTWIPGRGLQEQGRSRHLGEPCQPSQSRAPKRCQWWGFHSDAFAFSLFAPNIRELALTRQLVPHPATSALHVTLGLRNRASRDLWMFHACVDDQFIKWQLAQTLDVHIAPLDKKSPTLAARLRSACVAFLTIKWATSSSFSSVFGQWEIPRWTCQTCQRCPSTPQDDLVNLSRVCCVCMSTFRGGECSW